jgi:hypothetical protein
MAHGTVWCPGKDPQWLGINPGTHRLLVQCLNHYATPLTGRIVFKFYNLENDWNLNRIFPSFVQRWVSQISDSAFNRLTIISCWILHWRKRVSNVGRGENQNIHFMRETFLTKIVPLTKNTTELVVRFSQKNMMQKPIRCAYRVIFFSTYWAWNVVCHPDNTFFLTESITLYDWPITKTK